MFLCNSTRYYVVSFALTLDLFRAKKERLVARCRVFNVNARFLEGVSCNVFSEVSARE